MSDSGSSDGVPARPTRRAVLSGVSAASLAATAGCLSSVIGGGDGGTGDSRAVPVGEVMVRTDDPFRCRDYPDGMEFARFDAAGTPFVADFEFPALLEVLATRPLDYPLRKTREARGADGATLRFAVRQGTVVRSTPTPPPRDVEAPNAPRTIGETSYDGTTLSVFTTTPTVDDEERATRYAFVPFDAPGGRRYVVFTVAVESFRTGADGGACAAASGPVADATIDSLSPNPDNTFCDLVDCEPVDDGDGGGTGNGRVGPAGRRDGAGR